MKALVKPKSSVDSEETLNTITIINNKYCSKDFYARKSSDEQIKEYKNFHNVAYN